MGEPRVVTGKSARQWLAQQGVPPDFQAGRPLRYIHRRLPDADVYFVANGGPESFETACYFRVTGKQPELWHPETGRITPLVAYEERQGRTRVPLHFGPVESVFVVFRHAAAGPAERVVSVTRDGQELLGQASRGPQPSGDLPAFDLLRQEVSQPGTYVVRTAAGRRRISVPALPASLPVAGPWEVQFPAGWGRRADHASAADLLERARGAGSALFLRHGDLRSRSTCRRRCWPRPPLVPGPGPGRGAGRAEAQRPGPGHALEAAVSR